MSNRAVRYFYAVFVREQRVSGLLSALRYLCDPAQKYAAHVTVRGPYQHPLLKRDLARYSTRISGTTVHVDGVDGFMVVGKQNTVFLSCDGPGLKKVWRKPELPYRPHLTIYDGKSRSYAVNLLEILRSYDVSFRFTATRLYELRSSGGQQSFELAAAVSHLTIPGAIASIAADWDDIRYLDELSRLDAVQSLCDLLFRRDTCAHHRPSTLSQPLLTSEVTSVPSGAR